VEAVSYELDVEDSSLPDEPQPSTRTDEVAVVSTPDGRITVLDRDPGGRPHVTSCADARCDDPADIEFTDGWRWAGAALATDPSGAAVFAVTTQYRMALVRCTDVGCDRPGVTLLNPEEAPVTGARLALGADGLLLIYQGTSGHAVSCATPTCRP
jgi:hypothetical protein